ncbi:hypothetical protein O181_066100 [Austropuccinia psidii MF-1]|uniref:Uncharacterized protein n=1 Tax=Austropuccinia psidii MF-1 TaxID=1389203 RepID=A0A9Q3EWE5_9BASI|nr:hypothetical protein [Austropuccinia psidii MF-1]
MGIETVKKNNILYLTHICERTESKVTFLNQPDDNSISFITKQLKEFRLQVQNLENSTGHNAGLFQERSQKSDKERHELKENIQSSFSNISLENHLPRHSIAILNRNVLNLNNNDLYYETISSNDGKLETVFQLKDIPRLEELPTFSFEVEYKHMELMKKIDLFKEGFKLPDK